MVFCLVCCCFLRQKAKFQGKTVQLFFSFIYFLQLFKCIQWKMVSKILKSRVRASKNLPSSGAEERWQLVSLPLTTTPPSLQWTSLWHTTPRTPPSWICRYLHSSKPLHSFPSFSSAVSSSLNFLPGGRPHPSKPRHWSLVPFSETQLVVASAS